MNVNTYLVNDIKTIEASLEEIKTKYLSDILYTKLRSRCIIKKPELIQIRLGLFLCAEMITMFCNSLSVTRKLLSEIYNKNYEYELH